MTVIYPSMSTSFDFIRLLLFYVLEYVLELYTRFENIIKLSTFTD